MRLTNGENYILLNFKSDEQLDKCKSTDNVIVHPNYSKIEYIAALLKARKDNIPLEALDGVYYSLYDIFYAHDNIYITLSNFVIHSIENKAIEVKELNYGKKRFASETYCTLEEAFGKPLTLPSYYVVSESDLNIVTSSYALMLTNSSKNTEEPYEEKYNRLFNQEELQKVELDYAPNSFIDVLQSIGVEPHKSKVADYIIEPGTYFGENVREHIIYKHAPQLAHLKTRDQEYALLFRFNYSSSYLVIDVFKIENNSRYLGIILFDTSRFDVTIIDVVVFDITYNKIVNSKSLTVNVDHQNVKILQPYDIQQGLIIHYRERENQNFILFLIQDMFKNLIVKLKYDEQYADINFITSNL